MNNSKIVFLINDDVRAIMCEYAPNEKSYMFKTLDPSIGVDDFVVVPTDTRHEKTVCKVTEVDLEIDFDNGPELKWVIDRVDMEQHSRVVEMEKEAITAVQSAERRRKREELREAMFKDHEEKLKTLAIANNQEDDITE